MSHHGTNDSIAAQMDEDEPYGSVADGVFESRQRLWSVEGQGHQVLRTPTERVVADAQMGLQQALHSSMSEGVASVGNPPGILGGRDGYGSAERNLSMDRMGEFNPGERGGSARMGSGDANHQYGMTQIERTPVQMNEGVGGNSLMGGGEHSTGERGDRQRQRRSRERFGETTAMTQSVTHESNILFYDGDDNEGTNTPARVVGPDGELKASDRMGSLETGSNPRKSKPYSPINRGEEGEGDAGEEGNGDNGDHGRGVSRVRQVPSEFAMVTGWSDGENDMEMGMDALQRRMGPIEPTDSNMGCINMNDPADDNDKMIGSGSFKNRPSDADIIAWENQIKQTAQQRSMLVGDKVSLSELVEEYAGGSNEQFKTNISNLRKAYGSMRRSRGDGNCFFRAFVFSYLEHVAETGDMSERKRMVARLSDIKDVLLKAGYDELVLEGPLEILLDLLESDALTVEMLEKQLRTDEISNYIVFLMRIITSGEVKQHAEFFAPFILGMVDMGVDEFCAKCIDPMGEESDHIVLVALTNALRVPMRVVYVDGSANDGHLDIKDFVPDGCSGDGISVHLLYRPGHYDILYK